jgi:predicted Fe-Mo cluster-binding NifX family protein
MRIAVAADGSDLDAQLGQKFGTSAYLIIIDSEKSEFEAVPNPGARARRGSGMQAAVLAISREVDVVLTSYASPTIQRHLADAGIEVITGLAGTVKQVVERYREGEFEQRPEAAKRGMERGAWLSASDVIEALRSSTRQFANLLPILIGVVLLMGLFSALVSEENLASVFTGSIGLDALWGACFGSIVAGNPINSYVIGGELLEQGVSLIAVTALIVAWVTVGLVQMPAEIAALGRKFAVVRNLVCFVAAIPVAILTVTTYNLLAG